jgi:hypothetical protein
MTTFIDFAHRRFMAEFFLRVTNPATYVCCLIRFGTSLTRQAAAALPFSSNENV